MLPGWASAGADALTILVRLTPRSSRDGLDGTETGADGRVRLKARVRAVPEDGEANAALERLIAAAAGVPKSAVSVAGGHGARLKTLRIACADDDASPILARLEAALSR